MPPDLHSRMIRLFENKDHRRALLMAGALTAAYCVGLHGPEMADMISNGLQMVPKAFPFLDPHYSLSTWFEGGMNWLSTVGNGLADRAHAAGADIGGRVMETVGHMRMWLGDKVGPARIMFDETLSKTHEVMALTAGTVRASLPKTTADAASLAFKAVVKVAEAWGVWKAFKEISKETLPRIKRRIGLSEEIAAVAEGSGLTVDAVTNINVNIAISGADATDAIVEKVEAVIATAQERVLPKPTHAPVSDQRRALPTFLSEEDIFQASHEFSAAMRNAALTNRAIRMGSAFQPIYAQSVPLEGGLLWERSKGAKAGNESCEDNIDPFIPNANNDMGACNNLYLQ